MTSTTPNLTPLGDLKHGGALFTLPREIRDEIYRLLVKGRYLVFRHTEPDHGVSLMDGGTLDKPDLMILRISKAISREAQQVLYSESISRYEVPFYTPAKLHSSKEAVNRMKKIELDIRYGLKDALTTYYHNRSGESWIPPISMKHICWTILDDFVGTDILRGILRITFYDFTMENVGLLGGQILPKLCALNGFRTIKIEVSPKKSEIDMFWPWGYAKDRNSNTRPTANFERVRQTIKDAMEPSLGPAITRDSSIGVHLEFHPREHAPAILRAQAQIVRAQAQKLMLDADRLEQSGCSKDI